MSFKVETSEYVTSEMKNDYLMTFKLSYNNEEVVLSDEVFFEDPYTYEETIIGDLTYDDGYVVEIPKSYWDEDDDEKAEIISEYADAFKKAYKESLIKEVGVYGIASRLITEHYQLNNDVRVFNEGEIDNFASEWEADYLEQKSLSELVNLTSDDIENDIKNGGF